MRRTPEPELMLDEAQVRAYADADFDAPHSHFMALLGARFDRMPQTGRALDLGCGPGDISRRFATRYPGWRIDAIDGSATMLAAARERTPAHAPIRYTEVRLPAAALGRYDMIFSNSLLHHLAEPAVLWKTIRDRANSGSRVFVMDLLRPDSRADAERLVGEYAAEEPPVLQKDFLRSLCAAYEEAEIVMQLQEAELPLTVEVVSDRHVIVWGHVD